MTKSHRGLSETTVQGKLLQSRGDLSGYRINFLVALPQRPLGKQRYHAPSRLGLQLTPDDDEDALKVDNVIEDGNWDTPVVTHNQEQKQWHQLLHTVQPGDWLTAVNEKITGNTMLTEIERNTRPTSTAGMNLRVERELGDILGPYRAPARAKRPDQEGCKLEGTRSGTHRGKCRSTGDLDILFRRTCSTGWPQRRAVPSGNMSSLAWGNYNSYARISHQATRLPDIPLR